VAYLDTSAFVKRIFDEPEAAALDRFLRDWRRLSSSELLWAEAYRAASRRGAESLSEMRERLRSVMLVPIDTALVRRAATLQPPTLRTLDAIHLATAESMGSELGVVVTYDARLAEGARALGMPVAAPA